MHGLLLAEEAGLRSACMGKLEIASLCQSLVSVPASRQRPQWGSGQSPAWSSVHGWLVLWVAAPGQGGSSVLCEGTGVAQSAPSSCDGCGLGTAALVSRGVLSKMHTHPA